MQIQTPLTLLSSERVTVWNLGHSSAAISSLSFKGFCGTILYPLGYRWAIMPSVLRFLSSSLLFMARHEVVSESLAQSEGETDSVLQGISLSSWQALRHEDPPQFYKPPRVRGASSCALALPYHESTCCHVEGVTQWSEHAERGPPAH